MVLVVSLLLSCLRLYLLALVSLLLSPLVSDAGPGPLPKLPWAASGPLLVPPGGPGLEPPGPILAAPGASLGYSWAALGYSWAALARLLGRAKWLLWASWAALGGSWAPLAPPRCRSWPRGSCP